MTQSPLSIILCVFAPLRENKALMTTYWPEVRPRSLSLPLSRQVVLKSSNINYTKLITLVREQKQAL